MSRCQGGCVGRRVELLRLREVAVVVQRLRSEDVGPACPRVDDPLGNAGLAIAPIVGEIGAVVRGGRVGDVPDVRTFSERLLPPTNVPPS